MVATPPNAPASPPPAPALHRIRLRRALLPHGWEEEVVLTLDGEGIIRELRHAGESPPEGAAVAPAETTLGTVVPGIANLHSHAFQRGMAGLAQRRGGDGRESFWSWRQVMYAFVERLNPGQVEAVAALAYCEMLEAGFTAVGEFHYLHHAPDGRPYGDPGEMAARICSAAAGTGVALTLLPVAYRHGDVDGSPVSPLQRRFVSDDEGFARLLERAREEVAALAHARAGIAPHSLRALSVAEIARLLPLAGDDPVHLHVAEQEGEVARCLEVLGTRPVAHVLDTLPVDARWCLVHGTHMVPDEVTRLAASGAVLGVCPLTEADLGDGLAPVTEYVEAGGELGIGTDSHIRIDAAEALRLLEYGQRLRLRRRALLAPPGASTGRELIHRTARGGARALGQPVGEISVGRRADLVVLDETHPGLAGRADDAALDSWVFTGDGRMVREVWVGGRRVVIDGRCIARDEVEGRWRRVAPTLAAWARHAGSDSGASRRTSRW